MYFKDSHFRELAPEGARITRTSANSSVYYNGRTERGLMLMSTIIAKQENNILTLNSGGWRTKTTKKYINDFLPYELHLYQKNSIQYVEKSNGEKREFTDGMQYNTIKQIFID